jgi:hypothetical protein
MLGVFLFELPALGKTGVDASGPRNELLGLSLAKAFASSLPRIFLWPGTQRWVTSFRMDRAHTASRHYTPASALSLVLQGLAKLPGYLGKYTFTPLCT